MKFFSGKKGYEKMENKKGIKEEILRLEKKIEELKSRMPAHSVPIEMMQELEDLEDELMLKRGNRHNR